MYDLFAKFLTDCLGAEALTAQGVLLVKYGSYVLCGICIVLIYKTIKAFIKSIIRWRY